MLRQYMVSQGDVWDLVSFRIFGDECLMNVLLSANPTLRHIVQFNEPLIINVPERPIKRSQSSINLPPWKV